MPCAGRGSPWVKVLRLRNKRLTAHAGILQIPKIPKLTGHHKSWYVEKLKHEASLKPSPGLLAVMG